MRVKSIAATVLIIGLPLCALTACDDSDTNSNSSHAARAAHTAKPLTTAQRKARFLQTVDESISGADIEGNPYRYVGKNVDLHCSVGDIPDANFFNALCGQDADGTDAMLVVESDTRSLSKGQSVRVMGTVVQPVEGNNAMGGNRHFPTVSAQFME